MLTSVVFLFAACMLAACKGEFQFVQGGIALDTTDPRLSPSALGAGCDCSPTGAMYPPKVREFLADGLKYIKSIDSERSQGAAFELMENCTKLHGLTHCVDAEQSLRTSLDAVTICVYDTKTGVNLGADFEGTYRQVVKCKPQENVKAPAPTTTPSASTITKPTKTPQPKSNPPAKPSASSSPEPKSPNSGSGSNSDTKPQQTSVGTEGDGAGAGSEPAENQAGPPISVPKPTGGSESESIQGEGQGGSTVNEGCVAIEHLQGYPLQHRRHLLRPVLCMDGFCATPNHALIVGGRWTSLKRLCMDTTRCVRSTKLVNNLDVFKLRRVLHGDIIITPYDIRFPRLAVWIAQAVEKTAHSAAALSVLAALFALVVARRTTTTTVL